MHIVLHYGATVDIGFQMLMNAAYNLLIFAPVNDLGGHIALGTDIYLGHILSHRRQANHDILSPGSEADTMIKLERHT